MNRVQNSLRLTWMVQIKLWSYGVHTLL
jgi:hypothetical protein